MSISKTIQCGKWPWRQKWSTSRRTLTVAPPVTRTAWMLPCVDDLFNLSYAAINLSCIFVFAVVPWRGRASIVAEHADWQDI
jgi:hypothetical protein